MNLQCQVDLKDNSFPKIVSLIGERKSYGLHDDTYLNKHYVKKTHEGNNTVRETHKM